MLVNMALLPGFTRGLLIYSLGGDAMARLHGMKLLLPSMPSANTERVLLGSASETLTLLTTRINVE